MGQKGLKAMGPNCQTGLRPSMVLLRSYTPTSPQTQCQIQSFQVLLNAALLSNVMLPNVGLTCTTCQCAMHTLRINVLAAQRG